MVSPIDIRTIITRSLICIQCLNSYMKQLGNTFSVGVHEDVVHILLCASTIDIRTIITRSPICIQCLHS